MSPETSVETVGAHPNSKRLLLEQRWVKVIYSPRRALGLQPTLSQISDIFAQILVPRAATDSARRSVSQARLRRTSSEVPREPVK